MSMAGRDLIIRFPSSEDREMVHQLARSRGMSASRFVKEALVRQIAEFVPAERLARPYDAEVSAIL